MPSQTTVLITGANRGTHPSPSLLHTSTNHPSQGIGRGLVATYLLRPSHTVIAAVRDPNSTTSLSLTTLPVGAGSVLIAIPFDASSESSITNAINTLKTEHGHGVMSIQVVIANAGMATFYGSALQTPPSGMLEHYTTNVVGTLALFRVVEPLLKPKEEGGELPRFVTVSSTVGSIGAMEDWPMNATAYGASKAALNWLTKNIHIENEKLIAFPIHPG
jgi:norsolorinic acid ketoreductase